jgi:hypothetical protein
MLDRKRVGMVFARTFYKCKSLVSAGNRYFSPDQVTASAKEHMMHKAIP